MASVRLLSLLLESDDDEEESDVAAAESARWVAWVSLDPRGSHPHLSVYPGSVALMIEEARRKGETSVCLGEAFFGASIHLGARPEQRTRSGRRDARRIVLPAQGGEAVLLVYDAAQLARGRASHAWHWAAGAGGHPSRVRSGSHADRRAAQAGSGGKCSGRSSSSFGCCARKQTAPRGACARGNGGALGVVSRPQSHRKRECELATKRLGRLQRRAECSHRAGLAHRRRRVALRSVGW